MQLENHLCSYCLATLRQTHYHNQADNPVMRKWYGRAPIHAATALYHFTKKSAIQRLIHQMKYKHEKKLAQYLGQYYGAILKTSPLFASLEAIIPVPLHPKRLRERGYNQVLPFAQGLAEHLAIPCYTTCLIRTLYTTTQTKKTRITRLKSLQRAFALQEEKHIKGKHLLLVDDVITTGATLQACANTLASAKPCSIRIAALAAVT